MRAFFGILGLAGAGFLVSSLSTTAGCSSSNDSTGTAGSTGSAGSSGSAGTSGTAGTQGGGGNSGGSGGGGGSSGPLGCQMSDLPASATIADFSSTTLDIGGTFTYGSGVTAAVSGGAWSVMATSTGMTAAQYWGAGIYFNGNSAGTDCVDGTAYTGIQFDIGGTVGGTGCTVQFSINDSEHADSTQTPVDPKAGGPAGSYAPQLSVTVPATATTMMVPFTGTMGGSPATPVDKTKLTGVQWQFTTAAGAANSCAVNITIDNVKFY